MREQADKRASVVERLPISAIVPTRNRRVHLSRMLESLAGQSAQPAEMIVIDASDTEETKELLESRVAGLETQLLYRKASRTGAAAQRSEAIEFASHGAVLFLDDDIIFQPDCVAHLWKALQSDDRLGGVNAMITNQRYLPPGRVSRTLFRLLDGRAATSYAGRCIGPALNLLPEDRPDLPEVVAVEWLNTTCTLYRRAALPEPLFAAHFTGYSLMEDVSLSLTVGRLWKLANARLAQIFHDSQPGDYKDDPAQVARMELVNRHYIMTRVLGRRRVPDYLKLALLESFGIATSLASARGWKALPAVLSGKLSGIGAVLSSRGAKQQEQQ